MEFKIYDIVQSIAGRDQGNIYIINELIDNNYVNLIDGKAKTICKPKKKKYKHIIKLGNDESEKIAELKQNNIFNDGEIRKILKKYIKI